MSEVSLSTVKMEALVTDWSPVPSKHNISVRAGCSGGITAGNSVPLALPKVESCGLSATVAESLSPDAVLASWVWFGADIVSVQC